MGYDPGRDIGSIFSVSSEGRWSYAQYIFEEHKRGSLLRILPGVMDEDIDDEELAIRVASADSRFFVFVHLPKLESESVATFRFAASVPDGVPQPPDFKTVFKGPGGRFQYWVERNGTSSRRDELTPEEWKLSSGGLPNRTLLLKMIFSGWVPERPFEYPPLNGT